MCKAANYAANLQAIIHGVKMIKHCLLSGFLKLM